MVDSYSFGSIRVDGETYDHDLIYYKGQVTRWWREKGHKVKVGDIQGLLAQSPKVVVFGTGAMGVMEVSEKTLAALEEAGIEVICERTAQAIDRFNTLVAEGRDAALAVHLTC